MSRIYFMARLIVGTATVALTAACGGNSAEPSAAARLNEAYFIKGSITEIGQPMGYRVRGEPGASYQEKEAYFRIGSETELRKADGTPAAAGDLVVGREITLWITGPIAESFPVQVQAQRIVLK